MMLDCVPGEIGGPRLHVVYDHDGCPQSVVGLKPREITRGLVELRRVLAVSPILLCVGSSACEILCVSAQGSVELEGISGPGGGRDEGQLADPTPVRGT